MMIRQHVLDLFDMFSRQEGVRTDVAPFILQKAREGQEGEYVQITEEATIVASYCNIHRPPLSFPHTLHLGLRQAGASSERRIEEEKARGERQGIEEEQAPVGSGRPDREGVYSGEARGEARVKGVAGFIVKWDGFPASDNSFVKRK